MATRVTGGLVVIAIASVAPFVLFVRPLLLRQGPHPPSRLWCKWFSALASWVSRLGAIV